MKKLMVISLVIVCLVGSGCGVTASGGEHVGYITALEKAGLVWKTGEVYIKTDAASTQEDKYCVENEEVFSGLKLANASSSKVKLNYHSELVTSPWRCKTNTIVDSFVVVPSVTK